MYIRWTKDSPKHLSSKLMIYCHIPFNCSFVWVKKKLLKRRVRFQSGRAKRVIREQYRLLGRIK